MFTGIILSITFLCSCSGNKNSKDLLCSALHSSYSANADYVIDSGEKYIEGEFEILRADRTKINFLSPDQYCSVSVSSDSTGNADIFAFELFGIPADVPKSIAGDISLIFTLFSDFIPSKIASLPSESFTVYKGDGTAAVSFVENGTKYRILYSLSTGHPCAFNASDEKTAVSINISDFQMS